VTPLGVVPDRVAGTKAGPVRDGSVLVLLLGKRPLGAEGLLGRLWVVVVRRREGKGDGKKDAY
jgi:hypothetical protein